MGNLLGHLSTHWDFFDCGLLEHVIDSLQTCSAETGHGRSCWGGVCFLHGRCLLLPNASGESSKINIETEFFKTHGIQQVTIDIEECFPTPVKNFSSHLKRIYTSEKPLPTVESSLPRDKPLPFSLAKIKRKEINPSKADKLTTATIQSDIDDVWLKQPRLYRLYHPQGMTANITWTHSHTHTHTISHAAAAAAAMLVHIPNTSEAVDGKNVCKVFNIHINGGCHCSLQYSQLLAFFNEVHIACVCVFADVLLNSV